MGNKWQGEELLKFYTFIVYNLGFIISRNQRNPSGKASLAKEAKQAAGKAPNSKNSKSDKTSGKRSTKRNPNKRKPLSNTFYKDLLEYIKETLGNPNNRQISHLRCKMSKFFAQRDSNGVENIKLRWKNGMIIFEDLYSVYLVDPTKLLVSNVNDSVKTPHPKEEAKIEKQLEEIYGLQLSIKEKFQMDNDLLNRIDWPDYIQAIYHSLGFFIKSAERQKEIFRRMEDDVEITPENINKGERFLVQLKLKNLNLEKALIYANVHYKVNEGFDPRDKRSLPSSFKTRTLESSDRDHSSGKEALMLANPGFNPTNTLIQSRIPQSDVVNKKLKINSFTPVGARLINPLEGVQSAQKGGQTPAEVNYMIGANKMMERMKIAMKKSSDFKFVMPKLPPPMNLPSSTKSKNPPKPINLGQLRVQNNLATSVNGAQKSQPSSNESFSLLGKRVNSLNPPMNLKMESGVRPKSISEFRIDSLPNSFQKGDQTFTQTQPNIGSFDLQTVSNTNQQQNAVTVQIPTISQSIVQNLAKSKQKIQDYSPLQPKHLKAQNQELANARTQIQQFDSENTAQQAMPVTPARDPIPQFDEIKTSGVRFMHGIVSNFSDPQIPPSNVNLLKGNNQTIRQKNILHPGQISSFSPFGYTTTNSPGNQGIKINSHLKRMPDSVINFEKRLDVTTTIERDQLNANEESSFEIQESSFSKRLKNPLPHKANQKKVISKFDPTME